MRAVVFDCDGVLVDTETVAWETWSEVVESFVGVSPDAAHEPAARGLSRRDTHTYLSGHYDLPDYETFTARYVPRLMDRFEAGIDVFADVAAVVRELAAQGVPLAVASSSLRAEVDLKLGKVDLLRYFDVVAGGDEVEHTKPAPDVYLLAAERLGFAPRDCLVVEDTVIGAEAAMAAGMRVVVIARDGSIGAAVPTVTGLDAALLFEWLG